MELNGLTVACTLNGQSQVDYVFRDPLVDLNGSNGLTSNGFFMDEDDDVSPWPALCVHCGICVGHVVRTYTVNSTCLYLTV